MKKVIIWGILVLFVFGTGLPMGAYWLGLDNTIGRPAPPKFVNVGKTNADVVWKRRKEVFPIALRPITPWHFYELLWCSNNDNTLEDFLTCDKIYPGLRASAYVAKSYLINNMKQKGVIWRYLSRTALAIWISRNWSARELVAELIRIGE